MTKGKQQGARRSGRRRYQRSAGRPARRKGGTTRPGRLSGWLRQQWQRLRSGLPVDRIIGVALLGGLLALLLFLFVDDRFYVQAAEVRGQQFSSQDEVYRLAAIDGYSVFWVNGPDAARRIETLPFVKVARVRPLLPDKVRIDLVERQPVAVWQMGEQSHWVDAEGVLLPIAAQLDLPVLLDRDGSSVDEAGRVTPQLLAALLELRSRLPEVGLFAYDQERGLHFGLSNGASVYLGQPQGLARRVQVLTALQADLAGQGLAARAIDLRYEGGFYYR